MLCANAGAASMLLAMPKKTIIGFTLITSALLLLGGCTLPNLDNRSVSSVLPAAEASKTRLGQAIAPRLADQGDNSGIHTLGNPRAAFAARMLLADTAERTLDVQYYIWHGDVTGTLLLNALRKAAQRGVRVRLLLDDNGTAGIDAELAALAVESNIEVRLFNPFLLRKAKWFGYVSNFGRANRRMHNKSFTADNSATVIGGRNVGDEYFGATSGVLKQDLDVMAVGPVVQDVSDDFDRYWASQSSYPLQSIVPLDAAGQATMSTPAEQDSSDAAKRESYVRAMRNTTFVRDLLQGELPLEWAPTTLISDDPAKGIGEAAAEDLLIHQLDEILGKPESSVVLVSPYFVPTKTGTEAFVALANKGIDVAILTNALEATDVLPVHAGYAKRRKTLLEAGVKLYELRQLSDDVKRNKSAGPFGSSSSSLHAKTFAVDSERVFIGSFNFDPRSMHLNTELGFVIESPNLAQETEAEFFQKIIVTAYEVKLNEQGKLYWVEQQGSKKVRHDKEPGVTLGKRAALKILTILPIEWLL